MNKSFTSLIVIIVLLSLRCSSEGEKQPSTGMVSTENLPLVLPENRSDILRSRLKLEAEMKFSTTHLPDNINEWEKYRTWLKEEILKKTGVTIDHELPLDSKETGSLQMKGYAIKNIAFQTRPGVYATSNLFIPDGEGPFPAVIMMSGHSSNGRLYQQYQAVGHSLALNGYVCLTIDPWGAGERTTVHGAFEYHGSNLGASLMNIGESLIGMQITDNIRGIDLLVSLPYVDQKNIGATGASGGGNQTMWLAAIDERVKAAIPVVSVGTFESYVMGHNCICETLIDGLTFTEEAGVIALIAPRAVSLYNASQDSNPTFLPSEMLRTFNNARPIFLMYNVENHISNKVFDLTHGYHNEMRPSMLGWFDQHLKGTGTGEPKNEISFNPLPERELMVYPYGQRDAKVMSTEEYCKKRGNELRNDYLNLTSFSADSKKQELSLMLRIKEQLTLKKVHHFPKRDGWERIALETSDNKLIPLLILPSRTKLPQYTIVINPGGKEDIPASILTHLMNKNSGIIIADLSGTGEASSTSSSSNDKLAELHTLSRAELWLGRTVLGEWTKELQLVTAFMRENYNAQKISIDGTKEGGLAGLFLGAVYGNIETITLRDAPVSYLFDTRENVNFFSMGIHLPDFLKWGDVSLAAALSGTGITFIQPRTMSGRLLNEAEVNQLQNEFENIRNKCRQKGGTSFILK